MRRAHDWSRDEFPAYPRRVIVNESSVLLDGSRARGAGNAVGVFGDGAMLFIDEGGSVTIGPRECDYATPGHEDEVEEQAPTATSDRVCAAPQHCDYRGGQGTQYTKVAYSRTAASWESAAKRINTFRVPLDMTAG